MPNRRGPVCLHQASAGMIGGTKENMADLVCHGVSEDDVGCFIHPVG
jgi:hypothetical protein